MQKKLQTIGKDPESQIRGSLRRREGEGDCYYRITFDPIILRDHSWPQTGSPPPKQAVMQEPLSSWATDNPTTMGSILTFCLIQTCKWGLICQPLARGRWGKLPKNLYKLWGLGGNPYTPQIIWPLKDIKPDRHILGALCLIIELQQKARWIEWLEGGRYDPGNFPKLSILFPTKLLKVTYESPLHKQGHLKV